MNEGGRNASTFAAGYLFPELLQPAPVAEPTHAANRPREHAVGMLGQQLDGDHAAQGIANDVSFLDLQVIEQEDDVFDQLKAVGFLLLRLVRTSVSRQVQGDDLVIMRQLTDNPGLPPVDVGSRVQPMNQNNRLPLTHNEEVNLNSIDVEGPGDRLVGRPSAV